ncbi:MAG: beta-ketoacyl-ACP synthase III [Aquificota bacterium]|jgi:3-oxoacyl-[acyl-carrier-protein] synthase-3
MGTKILGVGAYLPSKVLTNYDLEKMVDTSDEWITERTGIKERRIAENETVVEMALKAAEKAIEQAQIDKEEIELIILATLSPQLGFPATACLVQEALGLENNAMAFDISAACSGFLYGLDIADAYLKSQKKKTALVIGAEKLSSIIDWSDRSTCVLFGDGAGAAVVRYEPNDPSDVLSSKLYTKGKEWKILYRDLCGYLKMEGRKVFKEAVNSMTKSSLEAIKEAGLTPEDIDLVIPHQANFRIIKALAEKLNIPLEKVYVNVNRYGNTSAASIPIAMYEAIEEGKLQRGMNVLLTAMGGGLTWGSMVLRF